MPKFGCKCGHEIVLIEIPNDHEGRLIWDKQSDEHENRSIAIIHDFLTACLDGKREAWIRENNILPHLSNHSIINDLSLIGTNYGQAVIQCPECRRIYVEKEQGTNEWDCYHPEASERK